MDVGTRIKYFHKQHQDFLRLLDEWESVIETAGSSDGEECVRGLARMRELHPELKEIEAHCLSEERNVDSPYRKYLQEGQLETLESEHQDLARLLTELFTELRFATLYQTDRARQVGRATSALARRHIQFGETLLNEIEQKIGEEAEQEVLLRYTQSPE
jgi:hemerythrin-like domain-containing protein